VKISLTWLREFVDLPETVAELSLILSDLGLVVEGVEVVGESLDDVIVARVDEVRAIKGADRVRLVVVDAGAGPLEIVCGAIGSRGRGPAGGFRDWRAHDARCDLSWHALLLT
jgi:phenylalanyl-tRNA synthetase beta chain